MAIAVRYVCGHCNHEIEAWDEGNPYFIDQAGEKHYAYHPDPKRGRCVGNDFPHLCLDCGNDFMIDSRSPLSACPKCNRKDIADVYHMNGRRCPFCRKGMFAADPNFGCIS